MKLALMFAGQGAQSVGMGKEFYETSPSFKTKWDQIELDFNLKQLCFDGPQEQLNDTEYCQSCLFALDALIFDELRNAGVHVDCAAGLSLGEYNAYYAAGAMTFEDGLNLTRKRGKIMKEALPSGTGMMAAVLHLEEDKIKQAIASVKGLVEIANYNAPGQIVISGETKAVEQAMEACVQLGARRVIPLAVSGAFHCSLLKDAAQKLEEELLQIPFRAPSFPVYNNISGDQSDLPIVEILKRQIASSVYFEKTIRTMIDEGVDTFIEIGPGKTIAGFIRKINPEVTVYNISTPAQLNEAVSHIKGENQ